MPCTKEKNSITTPTTAKLLNDLLETSKQRFVQETPPSLLFSKNQKDYRREAILKVYGDPKTTIH